MSVLAQVVASRGLQPEPVATDALTHLLGASPVAGTALATWAGALVGESFGDLSYSTQVSSKEFDGRPDLLGSDTHGVRLVAEAKFDAMLTKIQSGTAYLERLPKDQPGVLLFIVPEDRLLTMWPKLMEIVVDEPVQSPSPTQVSSGVLSHALSDKRLLAGISWDGLLDMLQHAIEVAGDIPAKADLEQLRGLVRWRTRTGWVPLTPGDLPDTAGRQLRVLRDCALQAAKTVSVQKVRNGTGDWGPGRYAKTSSGRWMYVGVSLPRWDRHGISPLWVSVKTRSEASYAAVTAALAPLRLPHGPGRYSLGARDWGVPLAVLPGAERDDVTASLVEQLKRFASLLDLAQGDVATTEPEEDLLLDDED